jgi:hypothetical protein
VFLTKSRLRTVGKVKEKVITKAQLERLLRKPQAIYKRDPPPLLTKHSNLKEHLIKHLFEQAEAVHLKSYKHIKL